jgi:hypothetical protein
MRKPNSGPPLPPLSFEALQVTEDIEEYAPLSLARCGDTRYYNAEKALGIMRTCVVEVLASRLRYYETLENYHSQWLREIREIVVRTVVGLVGVDIHTNEKYYSYFVDQTARRYLTDRARKRKKQQSGQPTPKPVSRKTLKETYLARFPETKILDICWAARQRYREWKRWLKNELKDDSTPDRAFRAVLTSGKKPAELRDESRPFGWQ